MRSYPVISIIIPVYNACEYLDKCIRSVLRQTYTNIEVILINDGSTDKSSELCEWFAQQDDRIKVLHKENEGVSAARNAGINMATGDFIAFVDADDFIFQNMYEEMYDAMERENADLVISGIVFDNGIRRHKFCKSIYAVYDNNSLMEAYLTEPYINHVVWNKLYKKELLREIRFASIRRNEDVMFTVEMLTHVKKAVYLNACYYIQCIRPNSMERSRFDNSDLLLLQAIEFRQMVIQARYPQFYEYVRYDYVKTLMSLMKRILVQHEYKSNKAQYMQLFSELRENMDHFESVEAIKTYESFVKYQHFMKMRYWILGNVRWLKNKIKPIIIWIKQKR